MSSTWTVISSLSRTGMHVESTRIGVIDGRHKNAVGGQYDRDGGLHVAEITATSAEDAAQMVSQAFAIVDAWPDNPPGDPAGYDRWTVVGFTAGGDYWSCAAVIGGEHQLADRWDAHAMYMIRDVFVVEAPDAGQARDVAYKLANQGRSDDYGD